MSRSPRDEPPPAPLDWPRRLRDPGLEPREVVDILIEALEARLPGSEIRATDEEATVRTAAGGVISAKLGTLCVTVAGADPAERLSRLQPFLSSVADAAEALRGGKREIDRERVVPLVKSDSFFAALDPGFVAACEALVADLSIVYAYESPHAFEILSEADRRKLGLTRSALRALACNKLRRIVPEVRVRAEEGAWAVISGSSLEPSLLLLDEVWRRLSAGARGDLVACAPARDVLLYTDESSDEAVRRLRQAAGRALADEGEPVSATLLRWTGAGWEPFVPRSSTN
jgi:uncharacterized protein YtpQ (UPF0354 family)